MVGGTRSLRVAAVQLANRPGEVARNLDRADALAGEAAADGAELVLLPELAASGYRIAPDIWDSAEPVGGPISRRLCAIAQRHHIHLGTTILEADGADFFNSFLLATPQGRLAGKVRKSHPAWMEARYYRGYAGPHVIETALGRIGIGICYENYLGAHVRSLAQSGIDLLLQPTAAATPPATWPVGRSGAAAFDRMLQGLARDHARMLGVPVMMANLCGTLQTPLPGGLAALDTRFPGLSSIVEATGAVVAMLGDEEGVVTSTVTLGELPARAALPRGRWSVPMPHYALAWPLIERLCARAYKRDAARAAAAHRLTMR